MKYLERIESNASVPVYSDEFGEIDLPAHTTIKYLTTLSMEDVFLVMKIPKRVQTPLKPGHQVQIREDRLNALDPIFVLQG